MKQESFRTSSIFSSDILNSNILTQLRKPL